jgi:hypothetical protein
MIVEFGDFLNCLNRIDLTLFSMLCASVSLKLLWLSPSIQFILVASSMLTIVLIWSKLLKDFNLDLTLILFLILSLTVLQSLLDAAAVFMILSMLVASFPGRGFEYYRSIMAHLADAISTILALGNHSESNYLLKQFMDAIGEVPALILFKTTIIGSVLLYARFQLTGSDLKALLRGIALLGMSMAARNLLLFF